MVSTSQLSVAESLTAYEESIDSFFEILGTSRSQQASNAAITATSTTPTRNKQTTTSHLDAALARIVRADETWSASLNEVYLHEHQNARIRELKDLSNALDEPLDAILRDLMRLNTTLGDSLARYSGTRSAGSGAICGETGNRVVGWRDTLRYAAKIAGLAKPGRLVTGKDSNTATATAAATDASNSNTGHRVAGGLEVNGDGDNTSSAAQGQGEENKRHGTTTMSAGRVPWPSEDLMRRGHLAFQHLAERQQQQQEGKEEEEEDVGNGEKATPFSKNPSTPLSSDLQSRLQPQTQTQTQIQSYDTRPDGEQEVLRAHEGAVHGTKTHPGPGLLDPTAAPITVSDPTRSATTTTTTASAVTGLPLRGPVAASDALGLDLDLFAPDEDDDEDDDD